MQDILTESLRKLKKTRTIRIRMLAILLVLSLLVSLDVFWTLRQPGLTLAGDADCGMIEHTHDESCRGGETPCPLKEHVHTIDCYSDKTADVETMLDWQEMFEKYPYTGVLHEDLVGIAKTQVGYTESTKNFQVDKSGVRHGYNRYGAWYGTAYSDWSATFVSFCLHYAGANQNEFPTNTGANSMAQQWKSLGKYSSAGNYNPLKGDLIFFNDNTVGIVLETFTSAVYVVRGDIEGAVQTSLIPLLDSSIAGWGKTRNRLSKTEMLDISNGPAVYIFDSGTAPVVTESVSTFSLRNTRTTAETEKPPADLLTYLQNKGGSLYITLLDMHDHEVPKDSNGSYIVYSDEDYKITFSSSAPNGFESGTYLYQVPMGVDIEGGSGEFWLDDNTMLVGTWEVSETGLITLKFNKNINDRSDVIISSTMGVNFPMQDEPINFDGKVTVTVYEKHEEVLHTELLKWGEQGHADNVNVPSKTEKTDPNKIYWTVEIKGNKNSSIPGSVITDQRVDYDWSYNHYYSEADMAAGIKFGAIVPNADGTDTIWHRWTVYPGSPGLTWTEDGWSYVMPETITCQICGNTIPLQSDGYIYYADYTTTPEDIDVAGALPYANRITVDNQLTEGWAAHTQTHVNTTINKNGTFISDATGGKFIWEIQVTIPGSKYGEPSEVMWRVMDEMLIVDQNGDVVGYIHNDLDKPVITANYYGTTINVPSVWDATENDPYAYDIQAWRTDNNYDNPIKNIAQIIFLKRCVCTENNCGRHGDDWLYWPDLVYCDCWTEIEDTTFTITYETTDISILKNYNSQNLSIFNKAILANNGGDTLVTGDTVPIPNVIDKEWVKATSDYIVKYKITVNESKIVLSDGSPVTIRDEMTKTISFIRGSLVLYAVDIDGNRTNLIEGVDYKYRYNTDLHEGEHDEDQHKHVLEIDILHPQPVTYYLEYDTTVVVQAGSGVVPVIKYQNEATITLWNTKITDNTTEKTYTNVNIASKRFGVEITKKAANETNKFLKGAKFGLFNAEGHLIIDATTDENGKVLFATDVANGIVLKEHVLYYVQELEAPPGYQLNDKQYWFTFCSTADGSCEDFKEVVAGTSAVRIPFDTIGEIEITNDLLNYDLPETGGIGTYPVILVSVILIIAPLVYIFIRRRKRERRGVG